MHMTEEMHMNFVAQEHHRRKAKELRVSYIKEKDYEKATKILKRREKTMKKVHSLVEDLVLIYNTNQNEQNNRITLSTISIHVLQEHRLAYT